jgi:hypothetical protein
MNRTRLTLALLVLATALLAPSSAQALPGGFFGIVPQTTITETDAQYMSAGGIESVRVTVPWAAIQPTRTGGYHWEGLDATVTETARARLAVFPFLYGTPPWLAHRETMMPVANAKQRAAWSEFLEAAVARYGPHGTFWLEHNPLSANPVPKHPIRTWQIWNEANFFYFAYPVSPDRYARLLELSSQAIKGADPGARVILSGLFGEPDQRGSRGMPAADFLRALYLTPGIESSFDGVALHPYAFDAATLERLVEELHTVTVENQDRVPLYLTEMGWGSQNDSNIVAFEQGIGGQARALRGAYRYLIANRGRLKLRGTFWFSWKDIPDSCSFCDSVGLFHAGPSFRAKPAWHAFVGITGGRPRP